MELLGVWCFKYSGLCFVSFRVLLCEFEVLCLGIQGFGKKDSRRLVRSCCVFRIRFSGVRILQVQIGGLDSWFRLTVALRNVWTRISSLRTCFSVNQSRDFQ